MATRKIIINGWARHGKDYLAAAVAKELGLRFLSASHWYAEKFMMSKFPDKWPCVQACYEDRVNCRALWYECVRVDYEDFHSGFMEHSDLFVGHRSITEHHDMIARMQRPFSYEGPLTVWVQWEGMKAEPASSCEWQTVEDIHNNHDLVLVHEGTGTSGMVELIREAYYE